MKSIPSALADHYREGTTSLALLWKVTRVDGTVYAFTDHDAAITYQAVTYSPSSAFDASAVVSKAEMNVDDLEVRGLLDTSGIVAEDIEAGLWDKASVELRRVNWASLSDGAEILLVGEIGNIERREGNFVCELRDLFQPLQRNIGRIVSPLCDAEVGDARCGVDMTPFTFSVTVTAVDGTHPRRIFTCSALSQAAGFFADGKATFTGGANAGQVMDIKNNLSGVITLQLALPRPVQVGDTVTVRAGCNKIYTVDADGVQAGDCFTKFDNVINHRGFWAVPGRDKSLVVGGQ